MTAQRLVRGNKARIIASLCAILFCIGLLALFQKNQNQLENVNKNYEICLQQQESLSTQLQVIGDYKSRLEKSLQNEKAEHKQTRTDLEARINDEKTRRDKASMEANLRFTSLQQHYKLLQTKHDDVKEQFEKVQQQHIEEMDKMQAKVKELQKQLKQLEKDQEKSIEHLKSTYMQLQIDKDRLEDQIKDYKANNNKFESDVNHLNKVNRQLQRDLESIKMPKQTDEKVNHEETILAPDSDRLTVQNSTEKNLNRNNLIPETENGVQNNEQNLALQKPSNFTKSTSKTTSISKANLDNIQPLIIPTMTPSSNKKVARAIFDNANNVLPAPNLSNTHEAGKKIPAGVVVPKPDDRNTIPEEINLALPNRYRNNIIEAEMVNEMIKETKVDVNNNVAIEGADQNQKNPAQEDPLHLIEKQPDSVLQFAEENQKFKKHMDLVRAAAAAVDNGALKAPPPGRGAVYEADAGGDYDKDAQKEDLQIEEAEPEAEEDDDDDYDGHLAARQKDPAVRN